MCARNADTTEPVPATEPAAAGVEDALETLVHQFADPYAFLRELVQNSLDAGSPTIEISVEFRPSAEDPEHGIVVVHIDDYGEGMTREIIDTKLTRLFSSSKEGDRTKIGKFGIGFVSVFAIGPDAVVVDTSRGGENWRVLFQPDRSFVRIARDEPVDGTRIQVIKAMTRPEADELRSRARDTVARWCKHAEAEILFAGQRISQPLGVDSPCQVTHEDGGLRIVAGYTRDGRARFGFYNRGLTLLEGEDERETEFFPGVTFKVSSPDLEHTLTRDNVLRDEGFSRVMALVGRVVEDSLLSHLADQLEVAARAGTRGEEIDILYEIALRHTHLHLFSGRALLRTISGRVISNDELSRAHRRKQLYAAAQPSALATLVDRGESIVLEAADDTPARAFAERWTGKIPRLGARLCRPEPLEANAELTALAQAVQRLLLAHGSELEAVCVASFEYPGSEIADRHAITQDELGEVTPVDEAQTLGTSIFSSRRTLVLNGQSATVQALARMTTGEPELAAYLLVKLFFLRGERSLDLDSRLTALAVRARAERVGRAAAGEEPS